MQFGIKSLLGAMVLLAAFVMGVFQFSEEVCRITLLITHLLCPSLWFSAYYGCHNRGLKAFFLCGLVTGIAPWIITLCGLLEIELASRPLGTFMTIQIEDSWKIRFEYLIYCSLNGIIAICGGLLGVWVLACCRPAGNAGAMNADVRSSVSDPLAPDATLDG